ncbi:MAG: flagellar biosynthetic protein FliO [Gammaproteobacteria bacterium]|nr:flagellar biosynthetic protein FliO [Gammaproteobacteria bacterium]
MIKNILPIALLFPFSIMANEASVELQKMPDVMGAGNIFQILAGLFVVLMMILGAGWMMKRFGGLGGVSNDNLKIVAGISVGQREKIIVVQVGEVQVLVGIAPGNIQTLHVLESTINSDSGLKIKSQKNGDSHHGFINHLKKQMKNRAES